MGKRVVAARASVLEITLPNGQSLRVPRALGSSRMEAFSDGVFSIASTLLVLDIALHPPGSPLEQLGHEWPGYLGYLVSF